MTMETSTNLPPKLDCTTEYNDSSLVYAVVLAIIVVLGLLGNSVALFAFIFRLKKRNAARCYCINLALADIFYMLTLPMSVVTHVLGGKWPFGDILCRFCFYIFYMNLYSSILFLTVISVNRYLAVVRPIQQWQGSSRRAKIVCSGIWIFTAVCATPFLTKSTKAGKAICLEPQLDPTIRFVLNNLAVAFGLILPLFVIIFCYVFILRRFNLRPADGGSNASGRRGRKKIKALAIIIIVLFMLCFLPYHIVRTVYLQLRMQAKGEITADYCNRVTQINLVMRVVFCFATGHGCFNPMVYFFYSRHFRSFLSSALHFKGGKVAAPSTRAVLGARRDANATSSQVPASQENADSTTVQELKLRESRKDGQLSAGAKREYLQIVENSPSNSCQSFTDY